MLALVHGEPGHAAVGIRHDPGAGRQRERDDGLAPLEGVFGACRHDGNPDEQREDAHLKRRERGGKPCKHTDEYPDARREEGTTETLDDGNFLRRPTLSRLLET